MGAMKPATLVAKSNHAWVMSASSRVSETIVVSHVRATSVRHLACRNRAMILEQSAGLSMMDAARSFSAEIARHPRHAA